MPAYGSYTSNFVTLAAQLSVAAYADGGAPPAPWSVLGPGELLLPATNFEGQFFIGESWPTGTPRALVVQSDSKLVVAFRGTDNLGDLTQFALSDDYAAAFALLFGAVQVYAQANGIAPENISFVGHSLGGAAVNNLRDLTSSPFIPSLTAPLSLHSPRRRSRQTPES